MREALSAQDTRTYASTSECPRRPRPIHLAARKSTVVSRPGHLSPTSAEARTSGPGKGSRNAAPGSGSHRSPSNARELLTSRFATAPLAAAQACHGHETTRVASNGTICSIADPIRMTIQAVLVPARSLWTVAGAAAARYSGRVLSWRTPPGPACAAERYCRRSACSPLWLLQQADTGEVTKGAIDAS
jgi:hypothetical protein